MSDDKLLLRFGYYKNAEIKAKEKEFKEKYKDEARFNHEWKKYVDSLDDSVVEASVDCEWGEIVKDQITKFPWPKSHRRYYVIYETYSRGVEEVYYWLRDHMEFNLPLSEIIKVTDTFTASEHSAFFGVAQQRVGLQQDKISQFLATIGKMIKELFQIVRELRIIDERMGYYEDSNDPDSKSSDSAEITLKGTYVDMVEGGGKSPASVYGMAREVQFTTLPDLFFKTHPKKISEIDEMVDKLDFNNKVKTVLKRKLRGFLEWKENTYHELKSRRMFTVKYLRQHYEVIRMYITWVKPYLRNIRRLQNDKMDNMRERNSNIISSFESSMMEVEILGKAAPKGNSKYYSVVLLHIGFRTKPSMSYQQEGYNRGPLHVGECKVTTRSYAWTDAEIKNYIRMRQAEELELISFIDTSVRDAMDAMGGDLEKYLKEAEAKIFPEKKDKPVETKQKVHILEPLLAPFKGFHDMFVPKNLPKFNKNDKLLVFRMNNEKKRAITYAHGIQWILYKNFKKSHGMIAW